MSSPHLRAVSVQPHTLSEAALTLVSRVPKLLRRLRDLEDEEARIDTQVRQLAGQLPETNSSSKTPRHPIISTPESKHRVRARAHQGTPHTPSQIEPRSPETPVKSFLLMESFALAMSVRSKRKGRIFLAGDGNELGELKRLGET